MSDRWLIANVRRTRMHRNRSIRLAMCYRLALRFVLALAVAIVASACNRIDQKKFDGLYRVGKEVEVDIDSSSRVRVSESEKLLKRFKTEISLLQGRTDNKNEMAALDAYENAAAAYKSFLDMRDLDLRGDAVDGRMLLGDGWVAVGSKFNFKVEATPSQAVDKYNWYWVNVSDAVTALLAAVKNNLTKANNLVNGTS